MKKVIYTIITILSIILLVTACSSEPEYQWITDENYTCPECYSLGDMSHSYCDGTGIMDNGKTCFLCGGDGYVACFKCNGKGTVTAHLKQYRDGSIEFGFADTND